MFRSRRLILSHVSLGLVSAAAAAHVRADESLRCRPLPPARPTSTGPGQKFTPDGQVQHFPGNTVICHISRPSATFDALCSAYEVLRRDTGLVQRQNLTWLPPESYHVTIFDGVTDAGRRPGDWPQMLPLDASMDSCNHYVGERLRRVNLGFEPPLRLVIDDSDFDGVPTVVPLRPIDDVENTRLRNLRDRISTAIGVRHANHDTYQFHTSFAYYVHQFTPDEEAEYRYAFACTLRRLKKALPTIELGAPEYCLFDDMFAFREQFRLKPA